METSFHPPLTLVPLLANYPHSHYSPPSLGVPPSHSNFWCHRSKLLLWRSCTVRSPFTYGFKVTGVYHVSFYRDIQCLLSYSSKRSAIIRFFFCFFFESGGGGVMNLVYGSSSPSYMDCMVFFGDECCISRRSGVHLTPCSCIYTSIAGLVIFGTPSAVPLPSGWVLDGYPSYSLYLVSNVHLYPVVLFCGVPTVAGGDFYLICVLWHVSKLRLITSLLIIILLLPPPRALRQRQPLAFMLRVFSRLLLSWF